MEELKRTEWSKSFEEAMRARLLQGAFRYGLMETMTADDAVVASRMAIQRLKRFENTLELECLVDAANLALCAFQAGEALGLRLESREHDESLEPT